MPYSPFSSPFLMETNHPHLHPRSAPMKNDSRPGNSSSSLGGQTSASDSLGAFGSASSNSWSSSTSRGVKRSHSDIANCDCEDVPLSKRINRLNIEHGRCHNGVDHSQAEASTVPTVIEDSNSSDQQKSFDESYPYSANSEYFSSNHLLYHLHMERVQRQIQRNVPNNPPQPGLHGNPQQHFQSPF